MTDLTPADRSLIARLAVGQRSANGIPTPADVARRRRAAQLVRRHLAPWLRENGLRVSPMGPGWSTDLDAHVAELPVPRELETLGWLPLDRLLTRLGSPGRGRWMMIDDGEVLVRLDLHRSARPDPVSQVMARIERRGEVRLREVLELRSLRRAGHTLPLHRTVHVAASVERGLGGHELSDLMKDAPVAGPPVRTSRPGPARRVSSAARRWVSRVLGRRRVVVAISGMDGSGKSTLVTDLREDLRRVGIRTDLVWTRPGMHLGLLGRVARVGRRILGEGETATVVRGSEGQPDGRAPASRTGFIGWVWSLLVTLAFLVDVRRRSLGTAGVVLFDRHMLDALVTLEVVYGGSVDMGLHRALVRSLLPPADLTFLLEVDPEVADARKPDDMHAASRERQHRWYDRLSPGIDGLVRIDATDPPSTVAAEVRETLMRLA